MTMHDDTSPTPPPDPVQPSVPSVPTIPATYSICRVVTLHFPDVQFIPQNTQGKVVYKGPM